MKITYFPLSINFDTANQFMCVEKDDLKKMGSQVVQRLVFKYSLIL